MREEDSVEREEMVQAYTGCGSVYNVPFTQSVILQRLREKRRETRLESIHSGLRITNTLHRHTTKYRVCAVCGRIRYCKLGP